jgi:putative flippase GtrA
MFSIIPPAIWNNPKFRQFIFYAICGGTGVTVDLACYSALIFSSVEYQLANAVGYAAGTLVSFFLNRHFTFKTYDRTVRRLVMFLATAGIGYAISSTMLWTFVKLLNIHPITSKLMTLAVVLAVQFLINRAVTFRATSSDIIKDE